MSWSARAPNGITTTLSIDEVLAARPDAVIYSGTAWDVPLFDRLLRAGVNVYTGLGGYFLPGQPEYDRLQEAGTAGGASLTAGGNIPGLISDVFPLFLSGYTGRVSAVRAWQRNHVSSYPSAEQIRTGLGIGVAPAAGEQQAMVDNAWVWALGQSARMVATAFGVDCTDVVLASKRVALAERDVVLEGSGYLVPAGTVAGAQWTVVGYSGDQPFITITNEQTAVLGLGPGWRENHKQPPWQVEIDGEPPIVATFGWPDGVEPGAATSLLNASRAMNIIPRLVAAPAGCVSVLDFPMAVAGDGLARP